MSVTNGQVSGGIASAGGVLNVAENYGKGAPESTGSAMGKGAVSGAATGAALGSVVPVIGTAIGAVAGGIIGGFVGLFSNNSKKSKYNKEHPADLGRNAPLHYGNLIPGAYRERPSHTAIDDPYTMGLQHKAETQTVINTGLTWVTWLSIGVLIYFLSDRYIFKNK
jgi:hypothetical protein